MSSAEYAKLVSEAGGAAVGLEEAIDETDPHAVPGLILEELPQLQTLTLQLEQAEPPAAARAAHEQLVRGLSVFQEELMDVSDEATLGASQADVYQSGVLFASVDRVESGGRMRWELSQSRGLATIRQALAELKAAGCTNSGLSPAAADGAEA